MARFKEMVLFDKCRGTDENDLNRMRKMVITSKKIKRYNDQMKKTISSLDEEIEKLIKKRRKQILVHI